MTLLIDYARDVVGMPLKGLKSGVHIGWTLDREKAERMRSAGASVAVAPQPREESGVGYEVSFRVGKEAVIS
jgi:hypothetical protein